MVENDAILRSSSCDWNKIYQYDMWIVYLHCTSPSVQASKHSTPRLAVTCCELSSKLQKATCRLYATLHLATSAEILQQITESALNVAQITWLLWYNCPLLIGGLVCWSLRLCALHVCMRVSNVHHPEGRVRLVALPGFVCRRETWWSRYGFL